MPFLGRLQPPAPLGDALDSCCNFPSEGFRTTFHVEESHHKANPMNGVHCLIPFPLQSVEWLLPEEDVRTLWNSAYHPLIVLPQSKGCVDVILKAICRPRGMKKA